MINVQQLHHTYADGTKALCGIDLQIEDGEFLLICGPNGSGKTTLIRHLNGILQPSAGQVQVNGLSTTGDTAAIRGMVGMVFQDADSQIIGETVQEDVAFGPENMGLSKKEIEERVRWALSTMGLQELADKPCYLLSGGEKRRVTIAGMLVMHPDTMIFDEPFSNLDYRGVRDTLRHLVEFHKQGRTVVITTHDVEKVIAHADRIVIMEGGRVAAHGSPDRMTPQLQRYGVRPPCYHITGSRPLSWLSG